MTLEVTSHHLLYSFASWFKWLLPGVLSPFRMPWIVAANLSVSKPLFQPLLQRTSLLRDYKLLFSTSVSFSTSVCQDQNVIFTASIDTLTVISNNISYFKDFEKKSYTTKLRTELQSQLLCNSLHTMMFLLIKFMNQVLNAKQSLQNSDIFAFDWFEDYEDVIRKSWWVFWRHEVEIQVWQE